MIDNAALSEGILKIICGLSFCLEMIHKGKESLPDSITESVDPELSRLAQDITDLNIELHMPQKESQHQQHVYPDSSPKVVWTYALVDAVIQYYELPINMEGTDLHTGHDYFAPLSEDEAENLSPIEIKTLNRLAGALDDELDGFIETASSFIALHLNISPVVPELFYDAYQNAMTHYAEMDRPLSDIGIDVWLPKFYDNLLITNADREMLETFGVQIH